MYLKESLETYIRVRVASALTDSKSFHHALYLYMTRKYNFGKKNTCYKKFFTSLAFFGLIYLLSSGFKIQLCTFMHAFVVIFGAGYYVHHVQPEVRIDSRLWCNSNFMALGVDVSCSG